jgi:hypothetical protein
MGTHFLGRRRTPIEQLMELKKKYVVEKNNLKHNSFSCQLLVRPTPLSIEYTLKVVFEPDQKVPFSVYVVNPKPLKLAEGATRLEHVYDNQKQRLCLYRPGKKQWDWSMLLSETAIPWAIEWLYFYEIWVSTGKWLGGGEHPPRKDA